MTDINLSDQFIRIIGIVVSVGIIVIIIIIFVFVIGPPTVKAETLERAAFHLADNLLASDLTIQRGILDSTKLDEFSGKDVEPYVRHCSFPYHVRVVTDYYAVPATTVDSSLDQDIVVKKDEWEFGFIPQRLSIREERTATLSTSVLRRGRLVPAQLRVTAYIADSAEVGCLIEKAYRTQRIHRLPMQCDIDVCGIAIYREDGKFCYRDVRSDDEAESECRAMDIPFIDVAFLFEDGEALYAFPLSDVPLDTLKNTCAALVSGTGYQDYLAIGKPVTTVLVCDEGDE